MEIQTYIHRIQKKLMSARQLRDPFPNWLLRQLIQPKALTAKLFSRLGIALLDIHSLVC